MQSWPPLFTNTMIGPQTTNTNTSAWLDSFLGKMRANPFDGSPKDWPQFIASYESFVHETNLPDHQKTLILSDVLVPNVRNRMAHLLQSPKTYDAALAELLPFKRYGDSYLLVRYHVQCLLALPSCKAQDHQYEFSSRLHDIVATL